MGLITETILPMVWGIWIKILFFGNRSEVQYKQPPELLPVPGSIRHSELQTPEAFPIFEFLLLAILVLIWGVWYRHFKKLEGLALKKPLMELRHVLINARKLWVTPTQRIQEICNSTKPSFDKTNIIDMLYKSLDFKRTRREILNCIFMIFSNNNTNLDKHFRISLMEPENDELKIMDFANSENERPKCMSLGRGLKKGEGTAGWAWKYMKLFMVDDLDKYRKDKAKGKRIPDYFIDMHPEQEKIKSIVSIPVIIREDNSEKLACVITIDTDVKGYFARTIGGEQEIRIRSYPFIRALGLIYQSKGFIEHLER
jgi:hypothetical protein